MSALPNAPARPWVTLPRRFSPVAGYGAPGATVTVGRAAQPSHAAGAQT
jgi:hypothetical protein